MKRKESITTSAMLLVIIYTMSLSFVSQGISQGQTSKTLASTGSIIITTYGLGVYSNSQGSTVLSSVEWGALEPGASQDIVCYIKNEGSDPTIISMQTSDWSPSTASTYLTLSWDYSGQAINPDAIVPITLTLSVSPDVTGITDFSFQISIIGN